MYNYLDKNKLIYGQQFGFRAKHSINHALISTTESIKCYIDTGYYASLVFIDLQKAFDTINHDILCRKLSTYLIIFEQLSTMSINGFESTKLDVKCGVPRGPP